MEDLEIKGRANPFPIPIPFFSINPFPIPSYLCIEEDLHTIKKEVCPSLSITRKAI
jgi:hypothetical protein